LALSVVVFSEDFTGDYFEVSVQNSPYVLLAQDFVSEGAISRSTIFRNQTLSSLGLYTGQYVYTVPNDNITLNIARAPVVDGAVPEPATWAMMILGFGLVGGALRRRTETSSVRYA
jgi:hypothetical protein